MPSPLIRVLGRSKVDLVPSWSALGLVSITLTDNDGGEADELAVTWACQPPFPAAAPRGTPFFPSFGSVGDDGVESMRDGGLFEVQKTSYDGDAESGYTMTVTSRSADFNDKMKEMDSGHYDDKSAGDIFQDTASKAGISAIVHPDLASKQIPYRLRHNQSPAGFATDLAAELGGTMKVANGQMLITKRNSGETASGTKIPPIIIYFVEGMDMSIEIEGRPEYKETGAGWFDIAEGVMKTVTGSSVGTGGRLAGVHPYSTEDEATSGGAAEGGEQARSSVSGSITVAGDQTAMAGAQVILVGFGADLEAAAIVAPTITHEWTFDESGGYLMTVDLESMKTE